MTLVPQVILKPRKARPFFAGHPWVFEASIDRVPRGLEPGAEVAVHAREGQFVARGLYNPQSAIRVRLYRLVDEPLDYDFWAERITRAVSLRRDVLKLEQPEAAYRLIASEGDGLSGLTVDRYHRSLVVRFSSLALYLRRAAILEILERLPGIDGLWSRTERGVADLEGLPRDEETAVATPQEPPILIREHGIVYRIDPRGGQKTGFYIDQRENRRAVARYCAGRSVLDLFCYCGGFSLAAAVLGSARDVLGVDSSAAAIEHARENAVLNGVAAELVRFEAGDVFETLNRLRSLGARFGVVICDPPKYARRARDLDNALKHYLRLHKAAMDRVEPGGLLVACSCSGSVDRTTFAQVLAEAAVQTGRTLQILEERGQAPDHPIAASCLETDYLKCMICRVAD